MKLQIVSVASAIWLLQRASAQVVTESPTAAPSFNVTLNATDFGNSTISGAFDTAECSAYSACAGLVDNCCPTMDGVELYCCYESELPGGMDQYQFESTLAAAESSTRSSEQATYFVSSSGYFTASDAPDGTANTVQYVRSSKQVYDLIYYKTTAITDANEFVAAEKKFYIDVYTTAPPCTQIIVQLDSLASAQPDNYPSGRHSRYFATTTVQNAWERLQFDFLDRPDSTLGDDVIDSLVLFLGAGETNTDTFYFKNLDIAAIGCTADCETNSPKSCPAIYAGESGSCADGLDNDEDGLVDCQDPECTSDPACTTTLQQAYASAAEQSQSASAGNSVMSWTIAGPINALLLLLAAFIL